MRSLRTFAKQHKSNGYKVVEKVRAAKAAHNTAKENYTHGAIQAVNNQDGFDPCGQIIGAVAIGKNTSV
jgi:hypothetical protein